MTTTPATQAIFPVTPEDREAAGQVDPANRVDYKIGRLDGSSTVQAFARHRKAHSLPGDAPSDKFLTAYVSEDVRIIGIEHETEADWQKVHDAHVALRDRLNERIAKRDKCPHKPAALTTSAMSATQEDAERSGVGSVDWQFIRECVEEARSDYVGYHESNKPGEPDTSKYDAALEALAHPAQATPSALSGDAGEGE